MKLSTRIVKHVPLCGDGKSGVCTRKIVLFVDCKDKYETYLLDLADEYHHFLTKDEHCTLLTQESPVINSGEIVFHYTSTTYRDWCNI